MLSAFYNSINFKINTALFRICTNCENKIKVLKNTAMSFSPHYEMSLQNAIFK